MQCPYLFVLGLDRRIFLKRRYDESDLVFERSGSIDEAHARGQILAAADIGRQKDHWQRDIWAAARKAHWRSQIGKGILFS